jgi:hypothetical protein
MSGFLKTYADNWTDLQSRFEAAVVMPTIIRPDIRRALNSVFAQDLRGRIHVLVGVDRAVGDWSLLDTICADRPPNCVVQVFYPGYSTSARHGGLSPAGSGGVLRCVLSYLANSPYVAYLDDDNWWRADHLRLLRGALDQADWAFSLRWFVHPYSHLPVCVDQWESVGLGGVFREHFGGFVDPNCLMLNKVACETVLAQWNRPLLGDPTGMTEDRHVFAALSKFFHGAATNEASVFYKLNPEDKIHPLRLQLMGAAYDHAGRCSQPQTAAR